MSSDMPRDPRGLDLLPRGAAALGTECLDGACERVLSVHPPGPGSCACVRGKAPSSLVGAAGKRWQTVAG